MSSVSLPDVNASIPTPTSGSKWRKYLAFGGPAFMVSVGYMDPGNWGTDMKGGSQYGYQLLWVIFVSNVMAQFLQILCARLGIVTGKDLAMSCRDYFKPSAANALWILCEIAIIACDLAEVIGSAVALNLLFQIPLKWGVIITGLDVLLLLGLMHFGFRKLEALVTMLVATVLGCFAYQMFMVKPDIGAAMTGMVTPRLPDREAILISVGILGATVMPHNLYLHSSLVQTRKFTDKRVAIKFNTIDTVLALSLAFFVNAAILILAAAMFHKDGRVVEELQDGHKLLGALLGPAAAAAFAIALLASGQSSTITGTLAGQIVMEGFTKFKLKPWSRRLITRSIAVVPAFFIVGATGGKDTLQLLILSQVVLSMQLPFAIFPLMMITSDRNRMGEYVNSMLVKVTGALICLLITGLNVYLLFKELGPTWCGAIMATVLVFSVWVWKYAPERSDSKQPINAKPE